MPFIIIIYHLNVRRHFTLVDRGCDIIMIIYKKDYV